MSAYFQYKHKKATLGYLKAGTGSETLLVFHGFGQDHSAFEALTAQLGQRFTIYSFDLFFHGKSEWGYGEEPMTKSFWKELIHAFTVQNEITEFSLMGFSLGGKFVFATLEALPDQVRSIFLLAPDGIKTSMWYSLATYPLALRLLFKSMILKPGRFNAIVRMAKALRLTDKGIIRFAESQMNTEAKRKQVYFAWVVFRHLTFDMKAVASLINTHSVELIMLIGKHDKIITAENMKKLLSRVKNYQLEILDTGHNGLVRESVKVFRNIS